MNVIYVCPRRSGKINEALVSFPTPLPLLPRLLFAAPSFLLARISISKGESFSEMIKPQRESGRDNLRKPDSIFLFTYRIVSHLHCNFYFTSSFLSFFFSLSSSCARPRISKFIYFPIYSLPNDEIIVALSLLQLVFTFKFDFKIIRYIQGTESTG